MKPLAVHVGAFVGSCLAVNALIFALAPRALQDLPTDPPGWLVGAVWTALFACFGLAHGVVAHSRPDRRAGRRGIELLAALCLLYPLYTSGLEDRFIGLAGNIVTAITAVLLAAWLALRDRRAALLVLPVVPWLVYASWTIFHS